MFGLGFGEILILLIVGLVVVGPKNLPTLMRTAGRWVGKARRMSSELRSQSGIDDLIRHEGLEREIAELRSLSRVNVIDTLVAPMASTAARSSTNGSPTPAKLGAAVPSGDAPLREREYPLIGCDAYGALPDDASPYVPVSPAPTSAAPAETPATPATPVEPSALEEPVAATEASISAPASPATPLAASPSANEPAPPVDGAAS